jgi:hypothetical protein
MRPSGSLPISATGWRSARGGSRRK